MTAELSLSFVKDAMASNASAFRVLTRLVPAGGAGDKLFPPTYKHSKDDTSLYAVEDRLVGGQTMRTVLLDSVASQANRMEEAILRAAERKECNIPILSVSIKRAGGVSTRVTVLDAPHRITDAIFRDSDLDGARFRESKDGKRLAQARLDNATPVFHLCPTALILGFWDSQSAAGAGGAKVARALVSEIIGLNAVAGRRTSSRIDPLAITKDAAKIYKSEKDMWTLDEKEASKTKGKPEFYGDGKPSSVNHGNILPTVGGDQDPGGVTISEAVQTTVLSLPQLRRLRFPDMESGKSTPERDNAARTVLVALALYAIALQKEDGYFLRSRCHLLPKEPPHCELLGVSAQDVKPFSLTAANARQTFEAAYEIARSAGLSWRSGFIELTPTAKLAELVRRSDEKTQMEGGEADAGV